MSKSTKQQPVQQGKYIETSVYEGYYVTTCRFRLP